MFSCSPLVPIALPILERNGFVVTRQDHPRISFVDRESEDGNIHSGNRTFTLRDVSLEEDDRAEFRCAVGPFLSNPLTLRVVGQWVYMCVCMCVDKDIRYSPFWPCSSADHYWSI